MVEDLQRRVESLRLSYGLVVFLIIFKIIKPIEYEMFK